MLKPNNKGGLIMNRKFNKSNFVEYNNNKYIMVETRVSNGFFTSPVIYPVNLMNGEECTIDESNAKKIDLTIFSKDDLEYEKKLQSLRSLCACEFHLELNQLIRKLNQATDYDRNLIVERLYFLKSAGFNIKEIADIMFGMPHKEYSFDEFVQMSKMAIILSKKETTQE